MVPRSRTLACPARNSIITALCFLLLRAAEPTPFQALSADYEDADSFLHHEDPSVDPLDAEQEAHRVQERASKEADGRNVRLDPLPLPLCLCPCLLPSSAF